MHEFWTIPSFNMPYTRSQNYTNMVISEHGVQTFEAMVIRLLLLMLSFDVFVPTSAHPSLLSNMYFIQIHLNVKLSDIAR